MTIANMPSKQRPSCDSSLFLDSLEIGLWGEKEKHVEYRVFVDFQERMRSALAEMKAKTNELETKMKSQFEAAETYTHDCHASLDKRIRTNRENVKKDVEEAFDNINVIKKELKKLPELRDAYASDFQDLDVRIDDLEYRVYGPNAENWPTQYQSDTKDESPSKEYSSSEEEPAPKPYRPRASPENEEDLFNYEPVSSQKTQKNARNTL